MTIADDDIINLRSGAHRWGYAAGEVLEARRWFLKNADGDAARADWDEHKAWFRRAAAALNPLLAESMAQKHSYEERVAAYEAQHRPVALSDAEMLALGKEVCEDPTLGGMMRQGRPLTNREFGAILMFKTEDEVMRFAADYLAWIERLEQERESGL